MTEEQRNIDEEVNIFLKLLTKSGYRINTVSSKRTILNRFTTYLSNNNIEYPENIDIAIIHDYLCHLSKKGFKETTINNYRRRIKEFFKYLAETKKIKTSPFAIEKKKYPVEFENYMNEYLKLKEHENTCFNSMKKIKTCLKVFYDFSIRRELSKHSDIKKNDLKDFIKYLVDLTGNNGNPVYKTTSVNRMLASLKSYIKWLSKKGIFCPGFSDNLYYLHKTQHLVRNILTRKELVAIFSIKTCSFYEFMIKCIIVLLYASGLRINELLSIELKDIDFNSCTLKIFESKTKKERVVHIGEVGAKYLKIFISQVRQKVCYDWDTGNKVFLSCYEGRNLSQNTVNHYLKAFCKKAGITKVVTCHCFRHSYGTHLLENGLGIKQVSDLMGHRDLTATEQYTRLSPERLRKTINLFHPLEKENRCHVKI